MTARQRIAHVTTVHHPMDPRIYLREVTTLRNASFETWLIARDAPGREAMPCFLGLTDRKGILHRIRRHLDSYRHLRKLKPNVVHVHDPELIPLAYLIRAVIGCRIIYDMHEDYAGQGRLSGRLLRLLEKWCFNWADHVVLAESSYKEILKGRPVSSTPILNYVLPPASEPEPQRDRPFTLIYTGTISNSRGLGHMLDLAREIRIHGLPWRVLIVGVSHLPSERKEAERRIVDEQLDTVVERVGWDSYVPWVDLAKHYASADLGLALFDPLPNPMRSILSKFYEYIYFGLPVVHSDFPLWRSFFESNGCGVSVAAADPGAVLSEIREIAEGVGLEHMRSSTQRIRNRYLWSEMEPRLLGLYAGLVTETSTDTVQGLQTTDQELPNSME